MHRYWGDQRIGDGFDMRADPDHSRAAAFALVAARADFDLHPDSWVHLEVGRQETDDPGTLAGSNDGNGFARQYLLAGMAVKGRDHTIGRREEPQWGRFCFKDL